MEYFLMLGHMRPKSHVLNMAYVDKLLQRNFLGVLINIYTCRWQTLLWKGYS